MRRDEANDNMEIDDRMLTWHEKNPFAHGSFGAVYRVTYEQEIVVAKMISLREVPKSALESTKKEYKREVALMSALRSQNIVSILGCVTRPQELVILMEFCEGGTLRNLLDLPREELPFGPQKQIKMALDVAYGMTYVATPAPPRKSRLLRASLQPPHSSLFSFFVAPPHPSPVARYLHAHRVIHQDLKSLNVRARERSERK
jgi:serine/threonine protein kinase